MAVTINAKGTSVPSFSVGKAGTTITQSGVISPPSDQNLTISLGTDRQLVVDAGDSGPALITASSNQDLHINPAVGGGQFLILNANRWPVSDGTNGQVLATNGSGVLSFQTVSSGGGTAPTIVVVEGTSQAASENFQYVLANTVSSTSVTLPANPTAGAIVWITNATNRTDHVILNNGEVLQGLSQNMTIDVANVNIQLRFINTTIGWRIL
jgi:hypothetical protein